MDIRSLINENSDYVIEMRRHFHKNPELSMEEVETTKKVAEELDKMGIQYEIPEDGVGVVGEINGKKPGKTIALRADMDALTVTEKTGVDYASVVDGKMHACGHDTHMAMLLGAAKILNEIKDELPGKIYLLFQPAEEIGEGAKYLMKHGNWFEETDTFFGTHIWSVLEAGKVSLQGGERMAAAGYFKVDIHGKSGHGSLPHETVDAVVVASAVVMNLQTLVSRKYSPLDSVVVTVGKIQGGNRFNIIAGEAELLGTTRYFNPEVRKTLETDFRNVVNSTCEMYGATADIEYKEVVLPTFNDPSHSEIAIESAKKVVGEENVVDMEKTTGGEDFSFYLESGKPGVFAFIGARNPELKADFPHHSECFNIDESVLANGAGVYAQYAVDYLTKED